MTEVRLRWAQAKVEDRQLAVELEGEASSGWKQSFDITVRLLGGRGEWGKVCLEDESVRVSEVTPGSEEKLHHFLESVIEQANASQRPDEASEPAADTGEEEGPDGQMARHFRSFAEPEPEPEPEGV